MKVTFPMGINLQKNNSKNMRNHKATQINAFKSELKVHLDDETNHSNFVSVSSEIPARNLSNPSAIAGPNPDSSTSSKIQMR